MYFLTSNEIQSIDGRPYPTTRALRAKFEVLNGKLVDKATKRPVRSWLTFSDGHRDFSIFYGEIKRLVRTAKAPKFTRAAVVPPPKAVFKRGARYYPSQTYLKQVFTDREGALIWQPKYWARRRKIQVEGRVTMFIRGKNRSYSAETLRNIYFLNRVSTPKVLTTEP